jgi:hypothetical protein
LLGVPAESHSDLVLPPLPVRASIYIAPDGTVHFGALFAELVPVAAALGRAAAPINSDDHATKPANESTHPNAISPPRSAG